MKTTRRCLTAKYADCGTNAVPWGGGKRGARYLTRRRSRGRKRNRSPSTLTFTATR